LKIDEPLIPKHGGYRKLRSFQLAQLVYDITVRFCERFVEGKSRTRDQMVQAARSGTQNIAEGSQASGTSKKTELKLTNVARASLEELRLDYEDYLRQGACRFFQRITQRLSASRRSVAPQWRTSAAGSWTSRDGHGRARTNRGPTGESPELRPCPSLKVVFRPWAPPPWWPTRRCLS
jgi:four helix bundle protein